MKGKGKLTSWNDQKGYGFITPLTGGSQLFVHVSAFENRSIRPAAGLVLTYTESTDARGRPCAIGVRSSRDYLRRKPTGNSGQLPVVVALLYFTGVAVACRQAGLPWWTAGLSPLLSLITYLAYAADKSAARQGAWRTQENTLHLLALAGGWPGALIARHRLRHKSRKPSFRLMFWITVVVNCGALVWLFSSPGVQLLQALTG